ncbi:hypothetical protein FQA39_LY13075 [Lamprigera yunnana]|nr:hypothetical protein FQA39_LY13075 [Lamprigera yunnana]
MESGPTTAAKAKIFFDLLGLEGNFDASSGWLHRFKKRYGIRESNVYGQKMSVTTMSCGSRSRLILKLAAKYNEQNATIWQLQRSNNTEENTRRKVISQAVPITSGSTENFQCTSIVADCSDLNENPATNSTSSKRDGKNHFNDFDSDDTDAVPNFTDSSSENSSSDLESTDERTGNSTDVKEMTVKSMCDEGRGGVAIVVNTNEKLFQRLKNANFDLVNADLIDRFGGVVENGQVQTMN